MIVRLLGYGLVDALRPFLLVLAFILMVAAAIGIAIMLVDYAQQSFQDVLHTPPLSDWHVVASGDAYVLTYPFACGLSFHQSGGIIAVDCPNVSYIALLIRSPDLDAICNGTALYDGAGIFNDISGEAIAYRGKALLCKLYSSSGGGGGIVVLPIKAGG